jgi:hypothetical protein
MCMCMLHVHVACACACACCMCMSMWPCPCPCGHVHVRVAMSMWPCGHVHVAMSMSMWPCPCPCGHVRVHVAMSMWPCPCPCGHVHVAMWPWPCGHVAMSMWPCPCPCGHVHVAMSVAMWCMHSMCMAWEGGRWSVRACTATRLVARAAPAPSISMIVSKSCVGAILPSSYLVRVEVGVRGRVRVLPSSRESCSSPWRMSWRMAWCIASRRVRSCRRLTRGWHRPSRRGTGPARPAATRPCRGVQCDRPPPRRRWRGGC